MDNKLYWICLQQCLGYGSRKVKDILLNYNTAEDFYNKGVTEWRLSGLFSQREIQKLEEYDFNRAKKILDECWNLGIDVVSIEDNIYPQRLKNIDNPPCVLYVKGDISEADEKVCVAVVGTRSATLYGSQMAFELSHNLAKAGVIIVSGGALGVDCAAHKGALQAKGTTFLVMGCGINHHYLMRFDLMRQEVAKTGALISEYPPSTPSISAHFPMRNRIISGLSQGVLVIEAGEKSGSLITANIALEQNRDLFAVPGNVNSFVSRGTNKLIKECAKPVTSAADILEEYFGVSNEILDIEEKVDQPYQAEVDQILGLYKERENKRKQITKVLDENLKSSLSKNALLIYSSLDKSPEHIDRLSIKAGVFINTVLQSITELELNGLIKSYSGKRYSK